MTEREQFEAAMSAFLDPVRVEEAFYREGENYDAYATLFAWEAWQASRATPADHIAAPVLPERVIDRLYQDAGVSSYHPDGDQQEALHAFAHAVVSEAFARLPATPADQVRDDTIRTAIDLAVSDCSSGKLNDGMSANNRERFVARIREALYSDTPADHIGDAAEKVDAGSVPVGVRVCPVSDVQCSKPADCRKSVEGCAYLAAPQSPQKVSDTVRDAVIDECAKVCDGGLDQVYVNGWVDCANERKRCAAAIRALKSAPPQKPVSEDDHGSS